MKSVDFVLWTNSHPPRTSRMKRHHAPSPVSRKHLNWPQKSALHQLPHLKYSNGSEQHGLPYSLARDWNNVRCAIRFPAVSSRPQKPVNFFQKCHELLPVLLHGGLLTQLLPMLFVLHVRTPSLNRLHRAIVPPCPLMVNTMHVVVKESSKGPSSHS